MIPLHSTLRASRSALAAFATIVLLGMSGCSTSPPAPTTVTATQRLVATVEAIDQSSRMVTLRGPEGKSLTAKVGPEVRNLGQVKVGDRVVMEYTEAVMAEVVKKGTGTLDAGVAAARTAPGDRPGAGIGEFVRIPVTIFDVDTVQNVVEVTGPRGYNRRIAVQDPKMRQFIRGLKKGDEVEVTFTEAFAVSVEPAR